MRFLILVLAVLCACKGPFAPDGVECKIQYGVWSVCDASGVATRSIVGEDPPGCASLTPCQETGVSKSALVVEAPSTANAEACNLTPLYLTTDADNVPSWGVEVSINPDSGANVLFPRNASPQSLADWTTCTPGAPCLYIEESLTGDNGVSLAMLWVSVPRSDYSPRPFDTLCYSLTNTLLNANLPSLTTYEADIYVGVSESGEIMCGTAPTSVLVGHLTFTRHH